MALVARSLHAVPNADSTVDPAWPLGNKPQNAPSNLGINLAAFATAAINLQNLPFGVAQSFNYRTYLTGTSASTAVLSVSAGSGTLGNWSIDGTGNNLANPDISAGSGTLFVSATDGVSTVIFPTQPWSIQSQGVASAVKFHANTGGCGFWFDNQYWATAEKAAFDAAFATIAANTNICFVEIVLTLAAITQSQGNISAGQAILNYVLGKVRTANQTRPTNRKIRIITKCWHKQFFPSGGGNTTDTRMWPPYWVSNGWILLTFDGAGGTSGVQQSQIDYTNAAAVADFQAIHALWLQFIDPIPEVEMHGLQDESTAVTGFASVNGLTPAAYQTFYTNIHNNLLQYCPHTLLWKTVNWMPPGGTSEVAYFNAMYATDAANNPGRFCYGGPDPSVRGTTAQVSFRGGNGGADWRNKLPWVDHTEEAFLNGGNATSPTTLVQSAITNQAANYVIGNFENWETYKSADWITAFNNINGVANPNIPSLGSWNTTP